jgi:hypothetical protein
MSSVSASPQNKPDDRGEAYRKPRPDVFTMLLVIALLAILLGITVLWVHMSTVFDWKLKGGPSVTMGVGAEELEVRS